MRCIDFESRSATDINRGASYYSQHKTTTALCLAHIGEDEDEARLWIRGESGPQDLFDYIADGGIVSAWNANFELCLWNNHMHPVYGWPLLPIEQVVCTAAASAALAGPRSLGQAGDFFGAEIRKDLEGKKLMKKMCKPQKKKEKHVTTLFEIHDEHGYQWLEGPEDLRRLGEYCKVDVIAERAIQRKIIPLTATEQRVWTYDQKINNRGLPVDVELAEAALEMWKLAAADLTEKVKAITGGIGASQVKDLSKWVRSQGVKLSNLDREAIEWALLGELPDNVRQVLTLRLEYAQAAIAKFQAILKSVEPDGRVRGTLLYHGARTARWTGKIMQPHNLARGCVAPEDIEATIALVMQKDFEGISMVYESPGEAIGSLVRPTIRAPEGKRIIACDFAGIEARALAWAASQNDLVQQFIDKVDIYCDMATDIYDKPINKKEHPSERFIGKGVILGSGYGAGGKTLQKQLRKQGVAMDLDFCKDAIAMYRKKYKKIVSFWYALDNAAKDAIKNQSEEFSAGPFKFVSEPNWLWMYMPTGRRLAYFKPEIGENRFGGEGVSYQGIDDRKQIARIESFGGKWAENAVSSFCRDLLVAAMTRLERAGYEVIFSVHDELVFLVDEDFGSLGEVEELMRVVPSFAKGLPIDVEGFEGKRYRK